MAKHPRMIEAIKNAKIAATSNRGMYPYTLATNVFKQDGTPLEEKPVEEAEEATEEETPVEGSSTGEETTTEQPTA